MTLNASGPISLAGTTAGQSIEVELGGTGTTAISLNDATVRTLAGVPSGTIVMPTNFWGKSNNFTEIQKIAGTAVSNKFGTSAAASSDGSTIVVVSGACEAFVYIKSGSTWVQQGPVIPYGRATSNPIGVAISPDGNTIFLGNPIPSLFNNVGEVFVYVRSGGVWSLSQTLIGTGYTGNPQQGQTITLSSDGLTLAVGGPINASSIGAVWIYTLSGGTWSQQAVLIPTGFTGNPRVGSSLTISSDGNYLVVGGPDNNNFKGAAWIFTRSGSTWTQTVSALRNTYVNVTNSRQTSSIAMASTTNPTKLWLGFDVSGMGVCLLTGSGATWASSTRYITGTVFLGLYPSLAASSDGATLCVGFPGNGAAGSAYAYSINATTGLLTLKQTLTGTGSVGNSKQGNSLALSNDGRVLVSCGPYDNSDTGAVWIFAK